MNEYRFTLCTDREKQVGICLSVKADNAEEALKILRTEFGRLSQGVEVRLDSQVLFDVVFYPEPGRVSMDDLFSSIEINV